ncbi:hypothetical protein Tco_0382562 [Tanacetum coccineum]
MQCRTTGNVKRFNPEFEIALVQQSGLVPAVKEPVVFDRIGEHVEITSTSSGVKQKFTTPVEKGRRFLQKCVTSFVTYLLENMHAAKVKSDSMSQLGVGKRLMSNMFSPHVPIDRPEPLSPLAESISIDRNARMCVAPSEEHGTKVLCRFRNACSNDFR